MDWFRRNPYRTHVIAFVGMAAVSAGMYFTAAAGASSLNWLLLGLAVLANILVLFVKG